VRLALAFHLSIFDCFYRVDKSVHVNQAAEAASA
jgi:hypothetical protein